MEREKSKVTREIVLEVRKGNLDRVEQLLSAGPGIKAPSANCRDAETAYNAWMEKIRGIYLETKQVLSKVPAESTNKKDEIYSLTGGNKSLLCHTLILFGYFTEAQKLVQPGDQELLQNISVAYLTPRIERALANARKGNDQELVDLRQEYEKFEPYTDLENSIRARIYGGK